MPITTARELFIFDAGLPDLQTLLAAVPKGKQILLLNSTEDGIEQITRALKTQTSTNGALDGIHIFSHGSAGALYLGSSVVNSQYLAQHGDALAAIGSALSDTGDILLYGCNVAQGEVGQAFVEQLAAATGADVAASTNPTTLDTNIGDLRLEASTGAINTSVVDSDKWQGVLFHATAAGEPNLRDQSQSLTNTPDLIRAGTLFAMLSYGDLNLLADQASNFAWQTYGGADDEGFLDNYAGYFANTSHLSRSWQLLGGTQLGISTDPNAPQKFTAGGLYTGYVDGTNLYTQIDGTRYGDSNAIVALSAGDINGDKTLVLAFRGTDSEDSFLLGGQTFTATGGYLHYEAFRPLLESVLGYIQNDSSIKHIVVSGHSLGGGQTDIFAAVDARRFASLSNSDLSIVSIASPGLDLDLFRESLNK